MQMLKQWWYTARYGWNEPAAYSVEDAERQGTTDALLEIRPAAEQGDTLPPWYLGAMKEHFDNIVRGVSYTYQDKDAPLHAGEVAAVIAEGEAARDAANAEQGYNGACAHFADHNPNIPPETLRNLAWRYWVISSLLCALELPMNIAAFRIFGDDAEIFTIVSAVVLGFTFLLAAHHLGKAWREGPFRTSQNISVFVTMLALPALTIVGVGRLRAIYFAQQTGTGHLPIGDMFMAFVIFNLTIFAVASALSYAAHPFGAELVLVGRKRMQVTRKAHERLRTQLNDFQNRRATLFAKHETEAHRISDQFLELVKRYMMSNVRARGGAGINGTTGRGSFLDDITVSLPLAQPWTLSTQPSMRGNDGIGESTRSPYVERANIRSGVNQQTDYPLHLPRPVGAYSEFNAKGSRDGAHPYEA